MSMHLNADELARLMMSEQPSSRRYEQFKRELAEQLRWALIRRLPARRGRCAAGLRVVLDERGAMASGYVLHDQTGYPVCDHGGVVFDEPTPRVAALNREIARLRDIAGR